MLDRRKELLKLICKDCVQNEIKAAQLIDEIIFIENNLTELRKLPFINVNPNNNAQQKATPASKQYKELLQQYTNCLKVLFMLSGDNEEAGESPLRQWARSRMNKEGG